MPEAPEVTVAARQLAAAAVGRPLAALTVTHPRTSRAQPAWALEALAGHRIDAVDRHGKWLVVRLGGLDRTLGIHLRMSGQLLLRSRNDVPEDRHVHAVLDLADDDVVWFRDPRTFGELRVLHDGAPVAPDLLAPEVTAAVLHARTRRRHVGVKAVLLDQTAVVSGIGSYLADEALHRAGIPPVRPAADLSVGDWSRVLDAARAVTEASAELGGVTLADEGWVDLHGLPGRYGLHLRVHAREACASCGTATARAVVGGRSARWCPSCQP